MKIKRGSTSARRLIFVADSSSTTGAGLASLAYNTASLVAYYFAGDLSNEVQITLATATLGTWASGGFVAVDNTNMPGWYEIGIPDAALDGGNEVAIQFRGAANMVPVNVYIELEAVDCQDATRLGLSALPNAAANANGGLPILSSSGTTLGYTVSTLTTYTGNTPQTADHTANIAAILADTNELQTDWANGGRLDLILDARSSQTSVDDLPTNTELATALGTADDATLAAIAALNDISAGDVRTELAVELARINADISSRATPAQVATELATYDAPTKAELDTAIDAIPTAAENAAALLDLSNGIETSITPRQAMRLILAAAAGKLSGAATTTITIRNVGDSKDRLTATVDADGNRSAVVVDGT